MPVIFATGRLGMAGSDAPRPSHPFRGAPSRSLTNVTRTIVAIATCKLFNRDAAEKASRLARSPPTSYRSRRDARRVATRWVNMLAGGRSDVIDHTLVAEMNAREMGMAAAEPGQGERPDGPGRTTRLFTEPKFDPLRHGRR